MKIDFTGLKKYWTITKIVVFAGLIIAVWLLVKYNGKLSDKAQQGENNVSVLTSPVKTYKTKDSLNAATVYALSLKLKDYERIKSNDANLINTLEVKGRKLQSVITANTITSLSISAVLKDSIRTYKKLLANKDTVLIHDTLRCFSADSTYYSISGCILRDKFNGHIFIPDWINIAITAKHKRFLGFLWYINKVKDEKVDILSKNPYVKIMSVDYTIIIK